MTFLTPMRASTSALPSIARFGLAGTVASSRYPINPSRRHASTTKKESQTLNVGASVQSAEEAIAEMKRKEAMSKKMGRSVDLTAMNITLLEPIVAPKFQFGWIFRKGGSKYTFSRLTELYRDRQFINAIIGNEGITKRKGGNPITSTFEAIKCIQPSYKAGLMLEEAFNLYATYNQALAAGDEATIRRVSTGTALISAQNIMKSKKSMSWELAKENTPPKIMSARITNIDAEGQVFVAQVVVRFDTEQVLTVGSRNGKQVKRNRVVEHIAFERILPDRGDWRIKETLNVTTPDFLKES